MRNTCQEEIYNLAAKNKKVIFIGSDLGAGVQDNLKKNYPNQFIMEGVSEQHLIGFATGLASEGFIPYVNTISTFLTRRCYEQIVVDACLHNQKVRLIGNGGGLAYSALGPTHLAVDDISILRIIPSMTVVAVSDKQEMKNLMKETIKWPNPIYIRLGSGGEEVISKREVCFGKTKTYKNGDEYLFISTGIMTARCINIADKLQNYNIGVIHCPTIEPLNFNEIKNKITKNTKEFSLLKIIIFQAVLAHLFKRRFQNIILKKIFLLKCLE